MELTQLKYFTAVAEELHFGKAAKRLHISQPPLSIQIRKLEEELGVPLFQRTSRVVVITDAGLIFLEEARMILNRADLALERMRSLAEGQTGFLSIGFNEPAINTFLPSAVFRFKKRYPEVELRLEEIETSMQFDALRNHQIQLGFLRPSTEKELEEFSRRLIFSEHYLLALPEKHPLRRYETVPPSALNGVELLIFARRVNPGIFDKIVQIMNHAKIRPRIRQDAGNKLTTLALVRAGVGAALVPESCRNNAPSGVIFRTLALNLPSVDIYALWQKDRENECVANFLKLAGC